MSTPAAKRRRIDTASQTLSKPFRSPFKTPFKSPLKSIATSTEGQDQPQMKDGDESLPTPVSAVQTTTPLAARSTNTLLNSNRAPTSKLALDPTTPRNSANAVISVGVVGGGKKIFSSPATTRQINADPEVARLLKEQRDIEKELRQAKDDLDAAEQAGKIERNSKKWVEKRREEGLELGNCEGEIDGELRELVDKWRGASRQAAEELFGRVIDRINRYGCLIPELAYSANVDRMGGPRAWKEAQEKQKEFQNSWNQEEPPAVDDDDDEDDEDDPEAKHRDRPEKRDLYAEYSVDPETENEKSQRANGVGDTGEIPGQEDVSSFNYEDKTTYTDMLQEFTMAMMLRTLNVDLAVIGYDKQQQRWDD